MASSRSMASIRSSSSGDAPKKKPMCRSVLLRRQQIAKLRRHGSRISLATKSPPCQQADTSEGDSYSMPVLELDELPEDVLHHIHSLVPLRDAARGACVSHKFLRSWRRFPYLIFNWYTSGLINKGGFAKKLADRVHCVLGNHSGTGVKTLELQIRACYNFITANHINMWLQSTIKSGIIKLDLDLPTDRGQVFHFPCLLLSRAANSLQSLSLAYCVFHPEPIVGCLRNLKRLSLKHVDITEDELECFLSCTTSLEEFEVSWCDMITFLKLPSHLQELSILHVLLCKRLNMIEIYAPKVTTLVFCGPTTTEILIKNPYQLKNVKLDGTIHPYMFQYAQTKLHSLASNLQTLILSSFREDIDMPTLSSKFCFLRNLNICCFGKQFLNYDFLSLASFLEACPVLESFLLLAGEHVLRQDSVLKDCHADSLRTWHVPEFHHYKLKKVSITGFSSAKSMIELTCHIVDNSSSLEHLVLDTTLGYDYTGVCGYMDKIAVMEAVKGAVAINRYVRGKVPSRVKFEVLVPCKRCHIPVLRAEADL